MTTALAKAERVEYGHVEQVAVHFDDLDAMGIVHNARYAVLLERALTTFWAERGHSFHGGQPTTPDVFNAVKEFTISYQPGRQHAGQRRHRISESTRISGRRSAAARRTRLRVRRRRPPAGG